ncbi:MAG TPA: response regulator transcription factor [Myxococcota bacterium]|nr:response regulator transcription factor [Myxococcota bacterium]
MTERGAMKVLYVEDDPVAREYIQKGLRENGFRVDVAEDGERGLALAQAGGYDLLLLDVNLPARDGFELLQRLRESGVRTPALFLSARGDVSDRVRGLDLGADDYLAKPFAFAELLARMRAVVRRHAGDAAPARYSVAGLELDVRRHSVHRDGQLVELTPKEFQLLEYLMRHAGHVVSRTMITEKVWGHGFETYSNLIDVHMNHLRRKIDRDYETKLLHTVKGVGYVLDDRSAAGASAPAEEDGAERG